MSRNRNRSQAAPRNTGLTDAAVAELDANTTPEQAEKINELYREGEADHNKSITNGHHMETHHEDQPPTHREDPLRSIPEVARQIGKHRNTVMNWARDGLFPVVREPGGRMSVRQSIINRFLRGTVLERQVE